ncbi:MAG: hypothetical protein R3C15_14170 [Thermoleophilia bacterium]
MSPAPATNRPAPAPVRLVAEAARRVARSLRDRTTYEEQVIDWERSINRDAFSA